MRYHASAFGAISAEITCIPAISFYTIIKAFYFFIIFMSFISKGMWLLRTMSATDVVMFKWYLIAAWMVLAILFPRFSTVNPLLWVVIAVLCLGYIIFKTWRNLEGWFISGTLKKFRALSMMDVSLFKLWMVAAGLALYMYVPRFRSINPWYIGTVFIFGMGWFLSKFR